MRQRLNGLPGIVVVSSLLLAGCRSPRIAGIKETSLRAWYVPTVETAEQARVPYQRVTFLDSPPEDRSYRVIGYVYPPSGKFRTRGEALNAIRAAASLYGADAVFVDQTSVQEGWGATMSPGDAFAGKSKTVQLIRAQAIIWN